MEKICITRSYICRRKAFVLQLMTPNNYSKYNFILFELYIVP